MDSDAPRDPGDHFEQRVSHLLEEARMVLPGVQTLFGFQLIAVFNARFATVLDQRMQQLHLGALVLIAVTVAMVMAPAAYHRLLMPARATTRFLEICSRLLLLSMIALACGMSLDLYLLARVILGSHDQALLIALVLLAVFSTFWFVLPVRWRAEARPRPPTATER